MELNERVAIICCSMQKATKNKFDTEKERDVMSYTVKIHFLTETL